MASLADHEKANGTRLIQLLVDKGTEAMRNVFDSIHPPATLTVTLNSNRRFLQRLPFINRSLMDILFPPSGAPSQSKYFDITLLFILLRNVCGLHPPVSTGSWDANPPASDTSKEADVARIKYFRDKLLRNITTTRINDADFNIYWHVMSAAVVRLGVSEEEVKKLKCSPLEENLKEKSRKTHDKDLSAKLHDLETESKPRNESHTEPATSCKLKVKGSKATEWTPSSKKHRAKFEKLVKILKTEPSKATQIEMYRVCLEDEFVIGRGSEGTMVYIGLCKDGTEVAVKSLPHHIRKKCGYNEKEILNYSSVRKEPHIVNYRYYTEENDSKDAYLVLDLCEETVKEYVKSKEVTMDTLKTKGPKFMREILSGLKALHCGKQAILHRDLKPSNIFLNVEGEIVLADFGISRKLEKEETTHESLARGTEGWNAVESLPKEEGQDCSSDDPVRVRYKKQSDIQVVGMIFFYILTKGKHPYGELNHRTYNLSEGQPVNLELLEDYMAKDLISWMLQHDLKLRPSVVECLKHPYLVPTDDQFHLLTRVGNQPEIKSKETSSPVLRQLNAEPLLTKPSWKVKIDADVMKYMERKRSYTDDVADLLRFIRNLSEHWHDEPPPAVVANLVGTPKDYLLKLFPFLPVVLHRIIRQNSAWRQRDQLKQFF